MVQCLNRRSFLRSVGAVGAGLAFSPSQVSQANKAKPEDINVALIGAGAQGEVLMSACLKMGRDSGIRFKAVCDIWENLSLKRASELLKRFGHETNSYLDYRDMLDSQKDLDAVIIATPDFWHCQQTVACLEAGLHVYCEVPMSNTLDAAHKMVQAARATGKLLQIGHQRRSNPRYIHCNEKLLQMAKVLGRITAVNGQCNRPARPDRGWSKRRTVEQTTLAKYGYESMHQLRNWMWYKGLGGGPAVDFGSHQIDVFNWFLAAKPKSVTARGGTHYYDRKTHEQYDTVMAVYEYETNEGIVTALYQTITTNGYGGQYEAFMGDQGTLKISESASNAGLYRDPQAPDWDRWVRLGFLSRPGMKEQAKNTDTVLEVEQTKPPVRYEIPVKFDDPYHKPHLESFFEAIRGRATLSCPPDTAYATTVTILKLNQAVKVGSTVDFKPDEFRV